MINFGFLLFKIDEIINWTLSIALFGYWISLVFLTVLSVFSIILAARYVLRCIKGSTQYHVTLGFIWSFIFFGGLGISSFISIIGVISIFERKTVKNTELNVFIYVFLPLIVYFILLFHLTIALRNWLISFWEYILYSNEEIENQNQDIEQINEAREEESKNNQENNISTFQIGIPIFLKKISNTLFTKFNKRDQKIARNHKENINNKITGCIKKSITDNNEEQLQIHNILNADFNLNYTALNLKKMNYKNNRRKLNNNWQKPTQNHVWDIQMHNKLNIKFDEENRINISPQHIISKPNNNGQIDEEVKVHKDVLSKSQEKSRNKLNWSFNSEFYGKSLYILNRMNKVNRIKLYSSWCNKHIFIPIKEKSG